MRNLRAPLTATSLVLLLVACGGDQGSVAPPAQPQVSVVRQGATPTPVPGAPDGTGPASGRSTGVPTPGGRGAAPAAAPPPRSAITAAAPGRYPLSISNERQGGPPAATPAGQSSQGILTVDPASPVAGGMAQSSTIAGQGGGFSLSQDTIVGSDGDLQLVRSRSSATSICPPFELAPDHPIQLVPAAPSAGASWGPSPFHSATISGTVSGFVQAAGSDQVAGAAVPVWITRLTIDISSGSYCGYRFTGRIEQAGDWAPSLDVFTSGTITSALQFAAFGQVTSITRYRLLATRPS